MHAFIVQHLDPNDVIGDLRAQGRRDWQTVEEIVDALIDCGLLQRCEVEAYDVDFWIHRMLNEDD
jgi:hypothetical protein